MNYAQIKDGKVVNIIIANVDFIARLPDSGDFVAYDLAGIGWNYNGTGFYPPQCHSEAVLNNYQWICANTEHNSITF